jgi:hypothetical protein
LDYIYRCGYRCVNIVHHKIFFKMTCPKSYFYNQKSIGQELNLIPLVGDATTGFTITFPLPFLLIGYGDAVDLPAAPPSYSPGRITLKSASVQDANRETLETLFIGLMQADRDDTDPTNPLLPIQYLDGLYRNYFVQYLNLDQQPKNLNTFLFPESSIADFWAAEDATPSPNPTQALYNFMKSLKEVSDLRMWGAPGTYQINPRVTGAILNHTGNWTHNNE